MKIIDLAGSSYLEERIQQMGGEARVEWKMLTAG